MVHYGVLAAAVLSLSHGGSAQSLNNQINAMGNMHGTGAWPRDQYEDLVECLETVPGLLESQDAAWAGWVEFFRISDSLGDPWLGNQGSWQEENITALPPPSSERVLVGEPCNYASNVAYYRSAVEMCQHKDWYMNATSVTALTQAFSGLAWGSAFMHGSWTRLGGTADVRMIDVVAYVPYQAAVASLPCSSPLNCNILRGLGNEPRRATGVEIAQELQDMKVNSRVDTWQASIDSIMADVPEFRRTFIGIVCHFINLVVDDEELVDLVAALLADLFGLSGEVREFLDQYLVTIRDSTQDIQLTPQEQERLGLMGGAVAIKMLFAFLFQEQTIVDPILLDPLVNEIAAELMPGLNELANALTGFEHYDMRVQECVDVYPGDAACRRQQPHSKWHEASANGLFDIMITADEIAKLLDAKLGRNDKYQGITGGVEAQGLTFLQHASRTSDKLLAEGKITQTQHSWFECMGENAPLKALGSQHAMLQEFTACAVKAGMVDAARVAKFFLV